MDAEIKAKWLDALRSGKYEQGTQALQRFGQFCCLGVLCDIVEPDGWQVADDGIEHDGRSDYPSETIRDKVNLGYSAAGKLAAMNDAGKTFAEIADYIEQNF